MKNDLMKSLDSLKLDINNKFNNINDKLMSIGSGFMYGWFSSWKSLRLKLVPAIF